MARRSTVTKARSLSEFFMKNPELTQADMARLFRVSEGYLSRLRAGTRQPSLPVALRISDATGVPVRALISTESAA